tara:strand:+ start:1597 stop:2196 length:600 start_codon:yes stop_codon:yes gene_type:complete
MADFVQLVEALESWGLTDALLPFLLIFVLMFAVLQKTRVLGEGKKNFNVIVALVISLLVVIPHVTNSYPPGGDVVDIINTALPNVSILVVAIIMLLVLIGILGGEARWMGGSLSGWIAIIAFLVILWIFGRAAGWFERTPYWLKWIEDPDVWALIIILLVFGIVIWFITRDSEEQDKLKGFSKFTEGIGDFFKGGQGGH